MYEYKFVKIETRTALSSKSLVTQEPKGNYHGLIEEHAKEGWRLVQIFAPAKGGYGQVEYYELIFERELG